MIEARSTSNKIEHLQPSLISIKINSQDLIQLSLYINSYMYDSPKSRKFLPLIHSLCHVLLPKAQTVWDELPAVDDRKLEGTEGCRDPYGGQDPYNDTVKFLTTAGDGAIEGIDSTDTCSGSCSTLGVIGSHRWLIGHSRQKCFDDI